VQAELGRSVAHLAALRRMAISIAAKLDAGGPAGAATVQHCLGVPVATDCHSFLG
jgi:hypothetical protein